MRTGQHVIFMVRHMQLHAHPCNCLSHTGWWLRLPTVKACLAVERVARRDAARMPAPGAGIAEHFPVTEHVPVASFRDLGTTEDVFRAAEDVLVASF